MGNIWQILNADGKVEFSEKKLHLMDISDSMLENCPSIQGETIRQKADADDAHFEHKSFDMIVAHSMLHYSRSPAKLMRNFQDWISSNGVISILVSADNNLKQLMDLCSAADCGINIESRAITDFRGNLAKTVISDVFRNVKALEYKAALLVESADSVIKYILTVPHVLNHINRSEFISSLESLVKSHIRKHGVLKIEKHHTLYIIQSEPS